jgi:hypothetical protein
MGAGRCYLTLLPEDALQRRYPLREVFNALRWLLLHRVAPLTLSPDHVLASGTGNLGDRRNDRACPDGERIGVRDVAQADVASVEAQFRQLAKAIDDLLGRGQPFTPVGANQKGVEPGGLFEVGVGVTERLAVPAQHVELVRESRCAQAHKIAGVAILGNQPQRFLLAGAADEDRRVRAS